MTRVVRLGVVLPLLIGGAPGGPAPGIVPDAATSSPSSASAGTWLWPVQGAVVRGFDPPENPYSAGHRGIDIAARIATTVVAPEGGVVTFAGKVAGQLYVTIDHGSGVLSTCSFVSAVLVHKGDAVTRGTPIARSGSGHPGSTLPSHLHFGVRVAGEYVDPIRFLAPPSVVDLIRLAPLLAA
jgi:murein DD-endopeptidase MepM/ murein hydrolase activator NlpD